MRSLEIFAALKAKPFHPNIVACSLLEHDFPFDPVSLRSIAWRASVSLAKDSRSTWASTQTRIDILNSAALTVSEMLRRKHFRLLLRWCWYRSNKKHLSVVRRSFTRKSTATRFPRLSLEATTKACSGETGAKCKVSLELAWNSRPERKIARTVTWTTWTL